MSRGLGDVYKRQLLGKDKIQGALAPKVYNIPRKGCPGLAPISETHHALQNFAKHYVLAIQPGCLDCCDKELGTIGVFASVGHAHPAGAIVF